MGVVMGAENREDGRAEMLLIASDEAASAPAETRVEKRLRATFEQFEDIHLPRGLEGFLPRQRLWRLYDDAVRIAISEGAT
jgi:hypothetical protein